MRDILKRVKLGDFKAISRLITGIEARSKEALKLMPKIYDSRRGARYIGITGPPGVGKSTIVDQLISLIRKEGDSVGVIAIDPSSPFSGGAVLGDRIRMQRHATDSEVFIRSLGSRGSHGGLSRATRDIAYCLDAAGFDWVIIETVGVGQTELNITELADSVIVVLVPEAGDTIQTMKAGLMEIGDIFVVNKAERPGADQMVQWLAASVEMGEAKDWESPVLMATALRNEGIEDLYQKILEHQTFVGSDKNRLKRRRDIRRVEFFEMCGERFLQDLNQKTSKKKAAAKIISEVVEGKENPYRAVEKFMKKIVKK